MAKRQNLQKMAAFNLGVAEGVHQKKKERDTDFHVSFLALYCKKSCLHGFRRGQTLLISHIRSAHSFMYGI